MYFSINKKIKKLYFIFSIILNKLITSIHFYIFINSSGSAIKFINADFTILYYFFFIKIEKIFYTKYNK